MIDSTAEVTLAQFARALRDVDALVIAAGAGMGVDSGLPDFRGPEGFWGAYPPYRSLGLRFEDLANPRWFVDDPQLAWGFYGHRLQLYRATIPHDGFRAALAIARTLKHGVFAFTSNVDGHFQRAGFAPDRVAEVHGAIETLQCTSRHAESCGVWRAPAELRVDIDARTFRARAPVHDLPRCPACGALARPNILMFGDWGFLAREADAQLTRLHAWLQPIEAARVAVIECGAGTAIPTVRAFTERLAARGTHALRVNVREPQAPAGGARLVGVAHGAREVLVQLAQVLA